MNRHKYKNTRERKRALPPRRPPVLGGRRPSRPPPHRYANLLDSSIESYGFRKVQEAVEDDENNDTESQRRAVSLGTVDVGVVEFQVRR